MRDDETIAAVATPPGKGAIAIVRVSGPGIRAIVERTVKTREPLRPRVATPATLLDEAGEPIDRGLALLFAAPASYTGEDVLELHVHGSPIVVRELMRALIARGARNAQPGEFTRRAFLNGKLDLHEADAIADLIDAESRSAARAALANLGGALADEVRRLRARLADALERLAGAIDFPDEVPDPDRDALDGLLAGVAEALERLQRTGEAGRLVREGLHTAIVGPPNAGKSSLLNALLGHERAIVSELPGTTRDTIEESVAVGGVLVRLVDTAGIRRHAGRLETAGIERSRRALAAARLAIVVIDGSRPLGPDERAILAATAQRPRVVFANKSDLGDAGARELAGTGALTGSAFQPASIAALLAAIAAAGWGGELPDLERPHLAALREFAAVAEALDALGHARATLARGDPIDLATAELQRAFSALGHVSERIAAEEVLDGVFNRFCIGK